MNLKRRTVALMLWWCEGTKPRRDFRWKNAFLYPIEITNTNLEIIKIFLDFLIEDLNVPLIKIKGQLQIHEGDDKEKMENFWSSKLGIQKSQFNKTIIRSKGKRFRNNHGTFKLRTYDRSLYEKLQKMLSLELEQIFGV